MAGAWKPPETDTVVWSPPASDAIVSPSAGNQPSSLPPRAAPSIWGKNADDVSRQILNGMTFGFGDNMEAALGALPFLGDKRPNETYMDAYRRNLAAVRGSMGQFQQEHPIGAPALEMAGAVIPAVITGGSTSAGTIAKPLVQRMLKGALVGSTYGALGTAGNANVDTAPELAQAAIRGAKFGGITGAAMPAIAAGMRKAGEGIADSALGIRIKDRMYGKTPAAAILDETSGITPAGIEQSARDKMTELQNVLNTAGQGKSVDIGAAQKLAQQLADEESRGINQPLAEELQDMADALKSAPSNFYGASTPARGISPVQNVPDTQRLKREFSDRFLNWNSTTTPTASNRGKQIYRAMDDALDRSVPESAGINRRISSLIPVAQRAENRQLQAGAMQQMLHRFGAPTGALAGTIAGSYYGGPWGAVAGLALPAVISSTPFQMGLARGLASAQKSPAWLENLTRYGFSQGGRMLPTPVTPQNFQQR